MHYDKHFKSKNYWRKTPVAELDTQNYLDNTSASLALTLDCKDPNTWEEVQRLSALIQWHKLQEVRAQQGIQTLHKEISLLSGLLLLATDSARASQNMEL